MTFPDICVSSNWLYRSWPPSPPLPNVVYFIRRSKRESIYSSWLCYSAKGWKTYLWGKKIYLRKWEHKTVIQKEIRFSPLHLFNIKIRDLYQGRQSSIYDMISSARLGYLFFRNKHRYSCTLILYGSLSDQDSPKYQKKKPTKQTPKLYLGKLIKHLILWFLSCTHWR